MTTDTDVAAAEGGNTTDSILAALGRLDPANDEHWTKDGLPAVKAVEQITGDTGLTRAAIDMVAPGFTREVAYAAAPEGIVDPEDGDDQADTDAAAAEGGPVVERPATLAECNAWANRIQQEVGPRDPAAPRSRRITLPRRA